MKRTGIPFILLAAIVVTTWACLGAAASSTTYDSSEATVTFTPKGCIYHGPKELSASQFTFTWVIEDTAQPMHQIGIEQLDDGKTVRDVAKLPANIADGNVPWIRMVGSDAINEQAPFSKVVSIDLTQDADFKPGPVYFSCWYWEQRGGALGPIETGQ